MTMPSKARRLGNAFRLGVIYAAGATAAMDEAKWITGGGAFLDAFFTGRGCKTFFSALRKEYSICR